MPTQVAGCYPSRHEKRLTLKDGREIFQRPVLWTDRELILDLFNRISPESLYMRFLRHYRVLPEDMLYQFTHLDYIDRFALAAVVEEEGKEAIIAVARYARDPQEGLTDLAIVVRDDWQNKGLGKLLLLGLIDAGREHGIKRFVSMMDPGNTIIRQTLARLGFEASYSLKNGVFQVEIVV
ncbi:MAG TPA: GNAT family N-acetyltransferase [Deltaproteobacteria bacterium]|nr:GNAT family N-acetyltransferase [Deltaproteobacteria bacterium]